MNYSGDRQTPEQENLSQMAEIPFAKRFSASANLGMEEGAWFH